MDEPHTYSKFCRNHALTRLFVNSTSYPFGSCALPAPLSTQIIAVKNIPRQSSAMRFRRLSQGRKSTSNNATNRAHRSPERGMNQTMWRLDDREERRDQATPSIGRASDEFKRSTSVRGQPPVPKLHDENMQDSCGLHIPGWGYSYNQVNRSYPVINVESRPSIHSARSAPAQEIRPNPSIVPSPVLQGRFRSPSIASERFSQPSSAVPLLSNESTQNPHATATQTDTVRPRRRARTNSSPPAFSCLPKKFASCHRPRFPSFSLSRSSSAAKKKHRHSVDVVSTTPDYDSPLHIRTPKPPINKSTSLRDRSGMPEKPLSNITNTALKRVNSVDVRRTKSVKEEGWTEAHERFAYGSEPGPALVDATLPNFLSFENKAEQQVAARRDPIRGKGRLVHVRAPIKREKAVLKTGSTPWIDERTVAAGFEPLGVVFD